MRDRNLVAITGVAIVAAITCFAQTHKVAPTPDSVVRAIGVYEWTGDLAKPTGSRFMPITVFIDGDLEDAGNYKPQPVPFALLSGNIYELEDAGLSKGNLVLESALHARMPEGAPGPAFDEGWTAYGSFKPPVVEVRKITPLKPSKNMPSIQVSGGNSSKPHLNDKSDDASASKGSGAGQPQQQTKDDSTSGTKDTTASSKPDDDPDRPTMHRRTAPPDDTASTGSSSTSDPNDPAERPTLKRRSPEEEKAAKDQKNKKEIATVTEAGSANDDPDRPRLHHGSNKSADDNEPAKLMGVPRDMHQMVAVSDAKNRDAHVFARPWEDMNDRAGVLAQMQAFARAKLTEYGTVPGVTPPSAIAGSASTPATGATTTTPGVAPDTGPPTLKRGIPSKASATTKSSATTPAAGTTATTSSGAASDTGPPTLKRGIPPKASVTTESSTAAPASTTSPSQANKKAAPTHTAAKGHHKTAAPTQVTLADEDLRGYTLSYGGAPTYVYQAHTVETGSVMRYITIVAQDNGMGQLKIALASVTDAAHLDRTPWMRLVDAVDVEASNRASLLFELRGQTSRQFALYRIIATKPEQIFVTGGAT